MNVYMNDDIYEKVMDIEFKKKLFSEVDENGILEKISLSDVINRMYEKINGDMH